MRKKQALRQNIKRGCRRFPELSVLSLLAKQPPEEHCHMEFRCMTLRGSFEEVDRRTSLSWYRTNPFTHNRIAQKRSERTTRCPRVASLRALSWQGTTKVKLSYYFRESKHEDNEPEGYRTCSIIGGIKRLPMHIKRPTKHRTPTEGERSSYPYPRRKLFTSKHVLITSNSKVKETAKLKALACHVQACSIQTASQIIANCSHFAESETEPR